MVRRPDVTWPVYAAAVKLYLAQWTRSRALLGALGFTAVVCVYDATALRPAGGSPWTTFSWLVPFMGFLAGYDTYEKLRRDGSLRLILLHGQSRLAQVLGFATGAVLIGLGAVALNILYLLISGRIPWNLSAATALPVAAVGICGWVLYAQLGSLLMPRDTAAIVGVVIIGLGAGPPSRFLPADAPTSLNLAFSVLWASFPTTVRLSDVLNGRSPLSNLAAQVLQSAAAVAVIMMLLGRRRLLKRTQQVDA